MTMGNSGQTPNFICLVILGCSKAVNSALWWVQLKRNASPSLARLRECDATVSTQTQHNNPNNTASRFTVTVSVRSQYVCGRLQSFQDWCHHSLLTRLHQQKACPGLLSRSRSPTALSRYPFIHSAKSTHASQSWKSDRRTSCETGM